MGDSSSRGDRALRDVTARGLRTRVMEAGNPDSPALVLVHGMFVSHRTFDDVIDELSTRFHVLAPDLPGFGESEKPSPARFSYGIEACAEAVADVIAAFGVGRASVIGHGMGGGVALCLAADHAELVQRLVLVDPVIYPVLASRWDSRAPLWPVIGGIFFKQLYGRALFRSYFRDRVHAPGLAPMARVDEHYDFFNSPAARESAHATLKALVDLRPIVARISRVSAPSLVVWGRDDRLLPVQLAHRLARELPNAKLEVMDAGHAPHEEHPAVFVELITQFLEGRRA
jgi:pimeloyl-ACP methyl ester carboxylesterase